MKKLFWRFWLPLLVLLACGPLDQLQTGTETATSTVETGDLVAATTAPTEAATVAALSPATATVAAAPAASATPEPTAAPTATETTPAGPPPPLNPEPALARRLPSPAEADTLAALELAPPPDRDDLQLAQEYQGVDLTLIDTAPPVTTPLTAGTIEDFQVIRISNNTIQQTQAELLFVSDHAYFWFEIHSDLVRPSDAALAAAGAAFDEIYEQDVFFFGPENRPGIDGDPRINLMHVTLDTLCGGPPVCVAGYYGSADTLPVEVDAASNERDIFFMYADNFGSSFYLNVLAHEFRHMIEDNHDANDWDWAVEGSASLAEALLGFPETPEFRASLFLEAPDQQLNRWGESGNSSRYGQGYLLNQYLFDQLGVDLYRAFATSPHDGLDAVDAITAEYGLDRDGLAMWRDWLAALVIHDHPAAPAIYDFPTANLPTAATTAIGNRPAVYETTVNQYAVDYYELDGSGAMDLTFTGSTLVPLLDTLPASGQFMWLAQRHNYSQMQLTRSVDLSGVSAATLRYDVYHDIEYGYDYAYVAVSSDGGLTWQGLTAPNMQGTHPDDDPSGSALTERYYTGRSEAWRPEVVDLSAYAGQQILLRFEYVTDPILTFGGLALDNIAIPEIGFYDDGENLVDGWEANGFVRATAYAPQRWLLQLVTFPGDRPVVSQLSLTPDQVLTTSVNLDDSARPPILIVAAYTPQTLEAAHYTLQVGP